MKILIILDDGDKWNESEREAAIGVARRKKYTYDLRFAQKEAFRKINDPRNWIELPDSTWVYLVADLLVPDQAKEATIEVVARTLWIWMQSRRDLRRAGLTQCRRVYGAWDPRNLVQWIMDMIRKMFRSTGSGSIKAGKKAGEWVKKSPAGSSARRTKISVVTAAVLVVIVGGAAVVNSLMTKAVSQVERISGPVEGAKTGVIYRLVSIDFRARNVTIIFADRDGSRYTVQTPITAGAELRLRQALGAEKMQPDDKVLEVGTGRIVEIPCFEPITGVAGRQGCWGSVPQIQIRQR